jgi:hypothetical protein
MDSTQANGNANATPSTSTGASSSAQTSPSMASNIDMVGVLGNLLKNHVGEGSNERVVQVLLQNMTTLMQQGKLNPNQMVQVLHLFIMLDKFKERK